MTEMQVDTSLAGRISLCCQMTEQELHETPAVIQRGEEEILNIAFQVT